MDELGWLKRTQLGYQECTVIYLPKADMEPILESTASLQISDARDRGGECSESQEGGNALLVINKW